MASKQNTDYIFRNMKVYGSTEWLADNKKKYRTVFDKNESSYIYTEFSFFNLNFKKKDWDLKLSLICVDQNNIEICNLNCDRTISQNHNLLYIREGWGTHNIGAYWKPGTYKWLAMIDDQLVAEKNFYIQDVGRVTATENPYFDIKSIKFYEGPFDNVKEADRKYFQQFSEQESRYIWAEITATNKVKELNFWSCEFVFNFLTEGNLLKGSISKLLFVYEQDEEFKITVGWGADKPGSWNKGTYFLDIIFMDQLIIQEDFKIGDDFVEYTIEEAAFDAPKKALKPKKQVPDQQNVEKDTGRTR